MYYDLHIHSQQSGGENTISEIVTMAKRLGIDGVGLVVTPEHMQWQPSSDIDIVKTVLIKPKNVSDLTDTVRAVRNKAEIIIVAGGVYSINRAASENPLVDIIAYPEFNRADSGMDHICMRAAQENNVAVEINFREVLETHRAHRAKIMRLMRRNVMLANKYGTKLVVCSGAFSKWNMRSPRDMAALLNMLEADIASSVAAVSEIPSSMVESNRKKLADKKWEGVEIVE